ncbi:MAG: CRISPR-associated endonuclease Cas3'' [Thermanaerothrix sp.]|nr:CRISPR-associated endonuclease Cas3'' [Thermanaerothrix sp.]
MSKWTVSAPCMPQGLDHLWAKSPRSEPGSSHTLVEHTWEALMRLSDLAHQRPNLPDLSGQPRLWHLLFWATFLHDWGKAAQGFQRLLHGKERRWPFRHEVLSLVFVDWVASDLSQEEATFLAAAIATHHKDFDEIEGYLEEQEPEFDPLVAMLGELPRQDVAALYHWIEDCAEPWIEALKMRPLGVTCPTLPPLEQAINGLTPQAIRHHLFRLERSLREWEDGLPSAKALCSGGSYVACSCSPTIWLLQGGEHSHSPVFLPRLFYNHCLCLTADCTRTSAPLPTLMDTLSFWHQLGWVRPRPLCYGR